MSWNKTKEFKALEALWYQKLERSGFNDIEFLFPHEHKRMLKIYDSSYFKKEYSFERFEEQEAYYRRARAFYWEHSFKDSQSKEIWRLHSEGFSYREIAKTLRTDSNRLNKDKIQEILQKIKKEFQFFAITLDRYRGDGIEDKETEEGRTFEAD